MLAAPVDEETMGLNIPAFLTLLILEIMTNALNFSV